MALPEFTPPPGVPDLDDTGARERWRIDNDREAEWVMAKYARFSAHLADLNERRGEYLAQLEAWYDDASSGVARDLQWARGELERWAIRRRVEDPDAKTLHLPSGTVSTRRSPDRVVPVDPGAIAESLARAGHPAYDDVIVASIKVDARALNGVVVEVDGWTLALDCGCDVDAWRLSSGEPIAVGEPWPWNDDDHEPRHSSLDRMIVVRQARLVVDRFPGVVVDGVVFPLPGVEVVADRVTATVSPRT